MIDLKIELLKFEDLNSYKELIDECFGMSNSIEKYEKYRANEGYKIFVVKDENVIVGSATQYEIDLFTFDFQPCLMLFNVAVKETYREHKIAKKLLEHIIENARNNGYQSIALTCLDTSYPAHKLY
ncbi:MAG: GNAT family N-acetyltransferase [Oscillospiraceae bacterium]